MRKTIFTVVALLFSLFVYAGASTASYNTSASFGTSPSCSGKGICGTGAARGSNAVAVTFTYNAGTKTFSIVISKQALANAGIIDFNGSNYNFDQQWTTPGDIADALNGGKAFSIAAGQQGNIADDGANKIVTYIINP